MYGNCNNGETMTKRIKHILLLKLFKCSYNNQEWHRYIYQSYLLTERFHCCYCPVIVSVSERERVKGKEGQTDGRNFKLCMDIIQQLTQTNNYFAGYLIKCRGFYKCQD